MKIEIKFKLKQDIFRTDVSEYPHFLSEWRNPDPQFLEDCFDHLNITELKSIVSDVKVYEQDTVFVREWNWTLSFEVNSISDLKEYLSEEWVMANDEFDAQRFISVFAGNVEEIEVEYEEDEDVVWLEVNDTDVSGSIVLNN
jgi:hypothetical protein